MKTPAPNTNIAFGNRLSAIRNESERRRTLVNQDRSQAALVRSAAIIESFRFLERVERLIGDFVDDLASVLSPDLQAAHRFFDGRYESGARLEERVTDAAGRVQRSFSRLVFLLEPDSTQGTFTVECRITVRNRDHESVVWTAQMDDEGLATLRAFLEQRSLAFAQAWCADGARLHD